MADDLFKRIKKNHHLRIGLPAVLLVVVSSYGLREFASLKYDFRTVGPALEDHIVGMKPRGSVTLESEYEKIKKLDIDNWENKRGPRLAQGISSVMELICSVQNYDWGVKGCKSLVGKIAEANMKINIQENKPYAEFWMGIHPNGPSCLKESNVPLSSHINENPQELGSEVMKYFNQQLPFLFKILSVNKALSIQAHPSKIEAEHLNQNMPHIYKDSNHKPELAVALTQFQALCGFRPVEEIKFYLENVPEFYKVIGNEKIKYFLDCDKNDPAKLFYLMKTCFSSLMHCPEDIVKSAVGDLINRLKESSESVANLQLFDLVLKLNNEFPGDVGIFCIYWLNYITLKPGEAIYLAPNEPHAYLSGDCVECMANSDNVIRAGLTPKFRDVTTLCDMLSYKSYQPNDILFKPVQENKFTKLFSPDVRDFSLAQVTIPQNEEYTLRKRASASILVVVEGRGKIKSGAPILRGSVFYLPCDEEFYVNCEENITIFQAFCNV